MIDLIIDKNYKKQEIKNFGLIKKNIIKDDYIVYTINDKVYFFELLSKETLRLYAITSKKSFYL
jgi:hypothetical protein